MSSEAIFVCEGYHDRSFLSGWLTVLGCSDPSNGGKTVVLDPSGKRVAGGQFAFHDPSGKFLRGATRRFVSSWKKRCDEAGLGHWWRLSSVRPDYPA